MTEDKKEMKTCVKKEKRRIYGALLVLLAKILGVGVGICIVIGGLVYGLPRLLDWWKSLSLPWWFYPALAGGVVVLAVIFGADAIVTKMATDECEERYRKEKEKIAAAEKEKASATPTEVVTE